MRSDWRTRSGWLSAEEIRRLADEIERAAIDLAPAETPGRVHDRPGLLRLGCLALSDQVLRDEPARAAGSALVHRVFDTPAAQETGPIRLWARAILAILSVRLAGGGWRIDLVEELPAAGPPRLVGRLRSPADYLAGGGAARIGRTIDTVAPRST